MSSKKLTLTKETLRQLDNVDAVNGAGLVTLHNTCVCPIPNTTTIRFSIGGCPSIACGTLTGGTSIINPGGSIIAH